MKEVEVDEVWLGCVAIFWFMAASAYDGRAIERIGGIVSAFMEDQPRLRVKSSRGTKPH